MLIFLYFQRFDHNISVVVKVDDKIKSIYWVTSLSEIQWRWSSCQLKMCRVDVGEEYWATWAVWFVYLFSCLIIFTINFSLRHFLLCQNSSQKKTPMNLKVSKKFSADRVSVIPLCFLWLTSIIIPAISHELELIPKVFANTKAPTFSSLNTVSSKFRFHSVIFVQMWLYTMYVQQLVRTAPDLKVFSRWCAISRSLL